MSSPANLKYTESHEWVRVDGDVATIGITAHAAQSLSDLVHIELPSAGDSILAGGSFGEIESVKAVSDLNSPVTGEVIEVNEALADDLSDVNEDPYGKGWMIKVRLAGDVEHLLDADSYDNIVAEHD